MFIRFSFFLKTDGWGRGQGPKANSQSIKISRKAKSQQPMANST